MALACREISPLRGAPNWPKRLPSALALGITRAFLTSSWACASLRPKTVWPAQSVRPTPVWNWVVTYAVLPSALVQPCAGRVTTGLPSASMSSVLPAPARMTWLLGKKAVVPWGGTWRVGESLRHRFFDYNCWRTVAVLKRGWRGGSRVRHLDRCPAANLNARHRVEVGVVGVFPAAGRRSDLGNNCAGGVGASCPTNEPVHAEEDVFV